MSNNTVLKATNLCKTFQMSKKNTYEVLKNINMEIREGEFVSVMGPSGSGKSTLLYNVSSMDRATSGSVVFDGKELSQCSEAELSDLRLREMGFIFQDILLLKNLCLVDNIVVSAFLSKDKNREEVRQYAGQLMKMTGIADIKENDITQASGGQLQRVGICRALVNHPKIIFGDEPTGALNSRATAEIMEILTEINRGGSTIMLVTHDARVAARTERVLYMCDGTIKSEKVLGKFEKGMDLGQREETLSQWLRSRGF